MEMIKVKITKFKDIPQLTRAGSYNTNIPLTHMLKTISEWEQDEYYQLQLNPNFQRGHVWTEKQQMLFVEFLLRGGKSARVIYFNKPSWQMTKTVNDYDDFVCVDGLQRITAVTKFLKNEIKVFGSYYKDFEDKIPLSIDLIFNVNDLKTEKEVLQWYVDMNAGGTPHTSEEINRIKKMIEEL